MMGKLFFGLLLLPPIEIFLWIWATHFVSGWWVFWWTIMAVFIGSSLIKSGLSVLPKLQGAQGILAFQLNSATPEVGKALTRVLAGLLFVIPGLLTDAFALILLLPPVQYGVQKWAVHFYAKRQEAMMAQMKRSGFASGMFSPDGFTSSDFPSNSFGSNHFSGTTVEGEARVVEPKPEKYIDLKKSANDH
jgi:UPF0716 protein FxsA